MSKKIRLEIQATRGRNLGDENETQQKITTTLQAEKQLTATLQDILEKFAVIDRIEQKLDNLISRDDMPRDKQTVLPVLKQVNLSKNMLNIINQEARRQAPQIAEFSVGQQQRSSYATNQQRAPLLRSCIKSSTLAHNLVRQEIHFGSSLHWKNMFKMKGRHGKQYGCQRKKKVKFKFKQILLLNIALVFLFTKMQHVHTGEILQKS